MNPGNHLKLVGALALGGALTLGAVSPAQADNFILRIGSGHNAKTVGTKLQLGSRFHATLNPGTGAAAPYSSIQSQVCPVRVCSRRPRPAIG